jgi:hypothetical protein
MFLQESHATKIPCSCFGQVVAHMQLHATIYIVWLYNLYKMVIHFTSMINCIFIVAHATILMTI